MKTEQNREIHPKCETVQHLFLPWLDGELSSRVVSDLEAHLDACAFCAEAWAKYRRTVQYLSELEPVEAPQGLLDRIRARIHRRSFWQRMAEGFLPGPRWVPLSIAASLCIVVAGLFMVRWSPWSPGHRGPLQEPLVSTRSIEALPVAAYQFPNDQRILPGTDELMRPLRALEADLERRVTRRATLQDDLVLNLSGSEDVFNRIQQLVREAHGRMFLMGIRHRKTGRVVRSRMVIQIPLERYRQVLQSLEGMAEVSHLFLERESVPVPPDRLRIRLIAVSSLEETPPEETLQMVSTD